MFPMKECVKLFIGHMEFKSVEKLYINSVKEYFNDYISNIKKQLHELTKLS